MHTDAIYCGDCQRVLGNTNEFPDESVDLIYVDPPFFSNKQYEVIWGDGYELRAFEDRWKGGIENYISWMDPKVREFWRVLKPNGTFYLHCDWHADGYLRVLLDRVCGSNTFRNEIAWCYSGGGIPTRDFPRKHDTIFRYVKGNDCTYNPEFRPYSPGTMERGRTPVKGKYFKEGLRKEGTPINDWWTDINPIHSPTDPEKLGYPTQKPLALLDRIIRVSSKPGDVVLDPMCGCGTAIASAYRLDRKWVGIDVSPTACKLMAKRMHTLGVAISGREIIGMPKTMAEIHGMQPFEFQNWVIQMLMGRVSIRKVGDMGIDGYLFDGTPVQVKQSENIGRNVVDNFETAIRRAKKTKGMIVAFSFGKGAYEEVARVKNAEGLEIVLKTTKELIEEE